MVWRMYPPPYSLIFSNDINDIKIRRPSYPRSNPRFDVWHSPISGARLQLRRPGRLGGIPGRQSSRAGDEGSAGRPARAALLGRRPPPALPQPAPQPASPSMHVENRTVLSDTSQQRSKTEQSCGIVANAARLRPGGRVERSEAAARDSGTFVSEGWTFGNVEGVSG